MVNLELSFRAYESCLTRAVQRFRTTKRCHLSAADDDLESPASSYYSTTTSSSTRSFPSTTPNSAISSIYAECKYRLG